MRRFFVGLLLALGLIYLGVEERHLIAQGTLSQQVLQLLSRTNAWIGTNTFSDLRVPIAAIPSTTATRIYTDISGNLYYNGALIAGVGGVTNPHNLLSSTHPDTAAGAVARGATVVGNATPAWAVLAKCTAGSFIGANATDTICSTDAGTFTNIPAANLVGTLGAVSGASLTALNATQLTSGTVPLARLSGITTTQLAAGAGLLYSQLTLTGGIVNADLNAGAAIAYSKLNLAGAIVTGDLANGTILFADWSANGCSNTQVPQYNGSAWVCKTLAPADITGAGSVTSVALAGPAQFTISGSPITTSGTLTINQANQTANTIFSGPNTGAATTPTFRALVNADLPLTGVAAGTYTRLTLNTAGVATAGFTTIDAATALTGILPRANGGTGVAVATDDTVLVGSGAAWVSAALPNCPTGALAYTTATNLFNCSSTAAGHTILSATHTDSLPAALVRGDMLIPNSTPVLARVAIGTAGTLWNSNATDPSWGNTIARGSIATSTPWTWTQTFNAAVTFVAHVVNITDTSSNQDSRFVDYQVAGTSRWYLRSKDGFVVPQGVAFASLPATPINGMTGYCTDCLKGSNPCSGASTGSLAVRLNGVWRCD